MRIHEILSRIRTLPALLLGQGYCITPSGIGIKKRHPPKYFPLPPFRQLRENTRNANTAKSRANGIEKLPRAKKRIMLSILSRIGHISLKQPMQSSPRQDLVVIVAVNYIFAISPDDYPIYIVEVQMTMPGKLLQ
jgi:hypothetical protein